jgi:hypothetical protein
MVRVAGKARTLFSSFVSIYNVLNGQVVTLDRRLAEASANNFVS